MSESTKRFTETLSTGMVTDNVTGKEYKCEMRIDDELLELVNTLHELADGNENQLLRVMTYLHDNYYDIWEEVNKECYE